MNHKPGRHTHQHIQQKKKMVYESHRMTGTLNNIKIELISKAYFGSSC